MHSHTGAGPAPTDAYTLVHLSDPHLSSLDGIPAETLRGKRRLGYLSWRRHRRHEHRGEVLAALGEDLARLRPDHIVVTGDLTHLGLPEELAEGLRWLRSLGPPERVSVVPGNHDAYAPASWERTLGQWWDYMAPDRPPGDACQGAAQAGAFPSLRLRGPLALVGLNTARPSAPLLAVGSLGREQLARLAELLDAWRGKGLLRVVLLHHPPLAGSVAWRKRLTDAAALREVLTRHGAELVLHGHAHRSLHGELTAHGARIPVLGVPSASAVGLRPERRARYHLLRVERDHGWRVRVQVRGYCPRRAAFVDQGGFALTLPLNAP